MNACLRELAAQIVAAFHAASRRARDRGAGLPQPERRHADGRRLRRALPGGDLRLRPDELDARRGLPLRAHTTAPSSTSAARPPTSGSSSTASRARRRSRSRSAACGRTSGCRTCSRSGSAAARTSNGTEVGPQSVGYELTSRALVFGGDVLTATDLAVAAGHGRDRRPRARCRPRRSSRPWRGSRSGSPRLSIA